MRLAVAWLLAFGLPLALLAGETACAAPRAAAGAQRDSGKVPKEAGTTRFSKRATTSVYAPWR